MNENQRRMIKFQRSNLIESNSSSSDESEVEPALVRNTKDTYLINYFNEKTKQALDHYASSNQEMAIVD